MPAPVHGEVQTNKTDGRKFITIKVGSNGDTAYRRVYLRTKDAVVARRRARALGEPDNPELARRLIDYFASSGSPEEERRRIADVAKLGPLIPSLDHDAAREELEKFVCDFGEWAPGEISDSVVDAWKHAATAESQRDILIELGAPEDYLAKYPSIFTEFATRGWKANPNHRPQREALEAVFGRRRGSLKRARPAPGPRLSACIAEFETEQEQRGTKPRHRRAYVKHFRAFISLVGDKQISELTKKDFVGFVDHVLAATKGRTNKTIQDRLSPIKAVLESARARMDDDAFPEALDNWLRVIAREKRRRPYKSPRKNREPMPPAVFKQLLRKADEWAELDWEAYAAELAVPKENDRRKRALAINRNMWKARHMKRTGLVTHSMLCLAANTGAQSIDFARLLWSELTLEGKLPLYRESREKPSHLLGSEIPRCCPLLPEAVKSLKRWREWQRGELAKVEERAAARRSNAGNQAPSSRPPEAEYVFTYDDGRPFDQEKSFQVSTYFKILRKAVGAGAMAWPVRSCRNIGATVRRNAHLPSDMSNAWLGHSARETNMFYTGEAPDDYLLPLVRKIREVFFR